jgi:hypothetical protein
MGQIKNAYIILVRKPIRNKPLRRPRRLHEDNINMDLRETGYELDSSGLGQGLVAGS